MAITNYRIQTMSRQDLDLAIDWAAAEGWNPGLHDADCFYAADHQGFLMGVLDGEPIASISVVKYDDSFGFLGFYIVKSEFRGQGYGYRLWQAGLEYLQGCTIGLDGVVAQQENYRKSGFTLAYRNIRYEGIGDGQAVATHCPEQVLLSSVSMEAVVACDRTFFPTNRRPFLQCWLTQPHSYSLGILQGETITGYGMLRACRSGYKIGPLFADTPEQADSLFSSLKAKVPVGQPFYLDVPEPNAAAVTLAHRYHMINTFETARMYNAPPPSLPVEKIFGVTTFELG